MKSYTEFERPIKKAVFHVSDPNDIQAIEWYLSRKKSNFELELYHKQAPLKTIINEIFSKNLFGEIRRFNRRGFRQVCGSFEEESKDSGIQST